MTRQLAGALAGALAAVLAWCTPSLAQDTPGTLSEVFTRLLQVPQHKAVVLEAAKQTTSWIRLACGRSSYTALPEVRIWQRPEFGPNGAPLSGAWEESVAASGCGVAKKLNVVSIVRSPGAVASQVLAPGDTRADPLLQRDTSRIIGPIIQTHASDCHDAYLDDTKLVSETPLVEHWIVAACGRSLTIEVVFTRSNGGTDIAAHAL